MPVVNGELVLTHPRKQARIEEVQVMIDFAITKLVEQMNEKHKAMADMVTGTDTELRKHIKEALLVNTQAVFEQVNVNGQQDFAIAELQKDLADTRMRLQEARREIGLLKHTSFKWRAFLRLRRLWRSAVAAVQRLRERLRPRTIAP